jgi:hypothetical protein
MVWFDSMACRKEYEVKMSREDNQSVCWFLKSNLIGDGTLKLHCKARSAKRARKRVYQYQYKIKASSQLNLTRCNATISSITSMLN